MSDPWDRIKAPDRAPKSWHKPRRGPGFPFKALCLVGAALGLALRAVLVALRRLQ